MRTFFIVAFIAAAVCRLDGGPAPSSKPSVRFDGAELVLASTGENPGESVREFIPAGESLDSWTKLASIRKYPKLHEPKPVAANLLAALKQQNPAAPSAVSENPSTGDVIVDFVTWPADDSFVEFNVFRYSKSPDGGLIAQQYAVRDYKNLTGFLKALPPVRKRLVDLMAKSGLEVVH